MTTPAPVAAGGETSADNLALACVSCSLRKGAKQIAVDLETATEVLLFNPRRDVWSQHFQWDERGVRLSPEKLLSDAPQSKLSS